MKGTLTTAVFLLAIVLPATACGGYRGQSAAKPSTPSVGVAEAMGGGEDEVAGFLRATEPPSLEFPRDHGPHRGFRTEWWYWTGNLTSPTGHRFGMQLVFFRQALAADPPARDASLAAGEMILAHAAVTDVDGKRFHHAERMTRAAGRLGGVQGPDAEQAFRVWAADWSAQAATGGDGFLPTVLQAADRDFAFELTVRPGKPLVLQGEAGLSRKSAAVGNASIYYSMTRLPIDGRIRVDAVDHDVRGEAWLDREWSTSALGQDQVGWDWFSLQLDDGSELMWYSLRRRDGTPDIWSRGLLVAADGAATRLDPARVRAEPSGRWTASDGGATYPTAWRLVGDDPSFELTVTPRLPDQELRTLVRYWEGSVEVRGTRAGKAVQGLGYLEMTGYDRR